MSWTRAASVARPQRHFGMGYDLAFEFAIWEPGGLLCSKDNQRTSRFFPKKYFAKIRRFEVLPSLFPRVAAVSPLPTFVCRKGKGVKTSS